MSRKAARAVEALRCDRDEQGWLRQGFAKVADALLRGGLLGCGTGEGPQASDSSSETGGAREQLS
jgi:hypothetical protein